MRNIPPDLLAKIMKQNQTIYENADPRMSIQVSRAKTTVTDSTYWTVETIRTKEGLGDSCITARRFDPRGKPNRLYNIYVDNGIVKTAYREYPDYHEVGWQYQFDLGQGSAVAIAFDGSWELHKVKQKYLWCLITDENPYVFWVDNSGDLYVQTWDDVDTRVHLASDVVKVKAERGWKNVSFPERDHGLIAAYIKTDGRPYYRSFCYQEVSDKFIWETEREVEEFEGTANTLNLFITNDYRTGLVIEGTDGKVFWLITDRNWAGMAIAPESITVAPIKVTATLTPIEYPEGYETEYLSVAPTEVIAELLFADTANEVMTISNVPTTMLDENDEEYDDWGWAIEFRVRNPIPVLTLQDAIFTDVESGLAIAMSSINEIGENTYRVIVDDVVEAGINNIGGNVKLTISGVKNPAGYTYETFTETFAPINLVPTYIPLPEVEAIWTE